MAGSEYNMMDLNPSKVIQLIGGPADGKEFLVLIPAADIYYYFNELLHTNEVKGSSVYRKQQNQYQFQA